MNKRIRARGVGTNVTRVVMQPTLEQTRRSFLILKILVLMYLILKIIVLMLLTPLPGLL